MADSKSSACDSKDKDNAAYLKRREQVRRAQRYVCMIWNQSLQAKTIQLTLLDSTHRERKETYIKTLEGEVLQLRTNETRITQEARALHSEVARLRQILDQHCIPYEHALSYGSAPHHLDNASMSMNTATAVTSDSYRQLLDGPLSDSQRGSQRGSGSEFYLSESDGSHSIQSSIAPRRRLPFTRGRGPSFSRTSVERSGASKSHRWITQTLTPLAYTLTGPTLS